MNIDINVNTEISKELEEIHLQVSIAEDKMRKQIIYLRDKATREALIALGWTPPWNYNMDEAPKDGTMLLLKNRWFGEQYIGSWRKEEEQPNEVEFWWYDNSCDSMPLHPIAWKPIID